MDSIFSTLNQFYDRIFVLSLPRLQSRIDYISAQLDGLNFEFFWGVDKEHTSLEKLKDAALYNTDAYRQFYKKQADMKIGMLCCSLGHLKIYEHIVTNKIGKTLILEDDAVPLLHHLQHFPAMINELPHDWELFYLGYEKNERHGLAERIKKGYYSILKKHAQLNLEPHVFKNFYPVDISKHIAVAGFHDCTHAYSLTLPGAQKLLAHQQPVCFNPDNLLSYLVITKQIRGYIGKPKLFNQLTAFNDAEISLTQH